MSIPTENDYVVTSDNQNFQLGKKLGKGGEGIVYRVVNKPNLLVKIYQESKRRDRKGFLNLEHKIKGFETFYDKIFRHLCPEVCWVQKAVYFGGTFQGYICRYVSGISLEQWLNKRWKSKNKDDRDIQIIAIKIAKIVACLHDLKLPNGKLYPILVGDLQPQNILVDSKLNVSIIDSDSFEIGEQACNVQFQIYVSPERLSNPNIKREANEENYVLAYLFFQMMMYNFNIQPYNHIGGPGSHVECVKKGYFGYVRDNGKRIKEVYYKRWKQFSPELQDCFKRAFHDTHPAQNPSGQLQRYKPQHWAQVFENNLKNGYYTRNRFAYSYIWICVAVLIVAIILLIALC
ncbi:hypothetical protein II898_01335 [bacterium]|nr:hypothetical protein [bacterium]MBR0192550.1 hypothetical protein [Thermoguttaceae bacterium]